MSSPKRRKPDTRARLCLGLIVGGFLSGASGAGLAGLRPYDTLRFMALSCLGFTAVIIGVGLLVLIHTSRQHAEVLQRLAEVPQLRREVAILRRDLETVTAEVAVLKSSASDVPVASTQTSQGGRSKARRQAGQTKANVAVSLDTAEAFKLGQEVERRRQQRRQPPSPGELL